MLFAKLPFLQRELEVHGESMNMQKGNMIIKPV
jgi:hypothetical protein